MLTAEAICSLQEDWVQVTELSATSSWQDLEQLTTEMEQLQRRNEDLNRCNQDLQGEIAALKLQARYAGESFQHLLKDTCGQAEHCQHQLENDIAAATARCAKLEEEKQELMKVRDSVKKSLDTVDGRNKELELFSTRQQTRYAHVERAKQQLETENQQLETENQQLKEQLQRSWKVPRKDISLNMLNVLGTGSWGIVVEGTFRGQKVAVKSMHDAIQIPQFIEVFYKEIDIMAQIRHPNLVLFIAAVIDTEGAPLIITELLGISLRKAYMKNLLKDSSKLIIFRDVASALNYLHLHHRGEIIHRDVSSTNVLLEAKPNNQWKAKLSDLGSAKLAIEAKTAGPGTPVYAAPEILKGGSKQTAKVDVYSFGVLLCEVILGQFPDEGRLPTMIEAVRGRCASLHGLVTSCTQTHRKHRPAMSTVLDKLDKLCNPHQVTQ